MVVVDSNAILTDRHLRSAYWEQLLAESRFGSIEVIVPEVVFGEVVGHHRRELSGAVKAIGGGFKDFARLAREDVSGFSRPDVDQAVERFDVQLRDRFRKARVRIETYEALGISIRDVTHRLHDRRSPFKENGVGLGDAVVWAHVTRHATRRVAFITNDQTDFCGKDGQLVRELADELPASASVTVYRKVDDYVGALLGGDIPLNGQALAQLDAIVAEPGNLEQIRANFERALLDSLFQSGGTVAAHVIESFVEEVAPVGVHALRSEAAGTVSVVADFVVSCRMVLHVEREVDGDYRSWTDVRLEPYGPIVGHALLDLDAGVLDRFWFGSEAIDLSQYVD